jgi:hypothetical protein
MKLILFLSILFSIISCVAKNENYFKKTDVIAISKYSIPDSSIVFDTIQIEAKAEEPNGCWSNLNFVLSKSKDFEYRLKAFGTFESKGGVCPAVMVYKDTLIDFLPTQKGIYLFYVNETPSQVKIDTLIVK